MSDYFPGTTVRVFDPSLYRDDRSTPLSATMKLATVICWYGRYHNLPDQKYGVYPSCIDVYFWHSKRVSKGHFADPKFVEIIAKPSINETINKLASPT